MNLKAGVTIRRVKGVTNQSWEAETNETGDLWIETQGGHENTDVSRRFDGRKQHVYKTLDIQKLTLEKNKTVTGF